MSDKSAYIIRDKDNNFVAFASSMIEYNTEQGPGLYPANQSQLGKILGLKRNVHPIMRGDRPIPEKALMLFAELIGESVQRFYEETFTLKFDPEKHDLSDHFDRGGKYIDQSGAEQAVVNEGEFSGTLGANSPNYSVASGTINVYQTPQAVEQMGPEELRLRLLTLSEVTQTLQTSLDQKTRDIKKIQDEATDQYNRLWGRIKDLEAQNTNLVETILSLSKGNRG